MHVQPTVWVFSDTELSPRYSEQTPESNWARYHLCHLRRFASRLACSPATCNRAVLSCLFSSDSHLKQNRPAARESRRVRADSQALPSLALQAAKSEGPLVEPRDTPHLRAVLRREPQGDKSNPCKEPGRPQDCPRNTIEVAKHCQGDTLDREVLPVLDAQPVDTTRCVTEDDGLLLLPVLWSKH